MPNTAEERERCAGEVWWPKAKAWLPRVEAMCHTAQPTLWPRVAHVPHTWAWLAWPNFCGQKCPSSLPFKSLQFPPFGFQEERFEIPSMFFSPIFSTSKHHNFLIRSRNWVIQVEDCLYSSPLPFPSDLAVVWLMFGVIYLENRTNSWNQGSVHILVISSF